MGDFYVYVHSRATTGEPFYVGKGTGNRVNVRSSRSFYWHKVVEKHGIVRRVVEKFDSEAAAFEAEKKLIAEFRIAGFNLVNFNDGGPGVPLSGKPLKMAKEMARSRVSNTVWINDGRKNRRPKAGEPIPDGWVKGRIKPVEVTHYGDPPKTRARQDGSNNYFYGKKHTDEWCKEHSARMKGRPHKPEAVEKRAAARRGKPLSAEYKAALSAGKKGKMVFNNGVTFKFFAAGDAIPEGWVRGRPMTDEYKASLNRDKKGKLVFNNGVNQKFFAVGETVPDGWVRGKVKKS